MRGRIFTADDTDVGAMKGLGSDSKLQLQLQLQLQLNGWILRLRGLPFNATDEDVVRRRSARPCVRHCAAPLPRQLIVCLCPWHIRCLASGGVRCRRLGRGLCWALSGRRARPRPASARGATAGGAGTKGI